MGIPRPSFLRRALIGAAAATLTLSLNPSQAMAAPEPGDATALAKVDGSLLAAAQSDVKVTFWVEFAAEADLSGAAALPTKAERGGAVREALIATATSSQADVKAILDSSDADYQSFWVSNSIKVTGSSTLMEQLAAQPEVTAIEPETALPLPQPVVEPASLATVNAVEWNIARINAPQVWSEFGRGEDIVVANVDTGVDYTHPAVDTQYRGRAADGTFNHNYNWWDPSHICPSAAPCDNNDHGTHTMGTMVGEDGANQVGVAPGAKWIAAKGCESSSCSRTALLSAGQWIVAPTDLAGNNPRPDLAPDVVNNSWGGSGFDPWYKDVVSAWIAAGIFPAFSNGNSGPSCNTSGSPGTYIMSYASGAFDINNAIASFSSRGAGESGEIKPNLAAPGVNVRSSIPGGYSSFSGTSMASPHTAAAVALMWSAAPTLRGDIAATRAILDSTAIDVDNTSCGGTAADNNVFGEGRLDAYAAVSQSPRGPVGTLEGTVSSTGGPVAGVTVVAAGPISRTAVTGADGTYRFPTLSVGDYTLTASKFGYVTATGSASVTESQTTVQNIAMTAAPSATVAGVVTSSVGPVAGAVVALVGTPVQTTTNASGQYVFTAPTGDYTLSVSSTVRCAGSVSQALSLTGDVTLNITLPQRLDSFGYTCVASNVAYPDLSTLVAITGDDQIKAIDLPFPVPLYGAVYRSATISTNGNVGFSAGATTLGNVAIPNTSAPNGALYPFWDDLMVDASAGVYTGVVGTAPHRWFAIEWRNVRRFASASERLSFVAMINEDGSVVYRYKDVSGANEGGVSATIGLENAAGTVAFQYSFNENVLTDGAAIGFYSTNHGVIRGTVTDANDGLPVANASVALTRGGSSIGSASSDADGAWLAQLTKGDLTATVSATAYESQSVTANVSAGGVTVVDTSLRTAWVRVNPSSLVVVAPSGTRTRTITITNGGGLATPVSLAEVGGDVPWLSASMGAASLEPGASTTVTVTVDTTGLAAGSVSNAALKVTSNSGRSPETTIPVRLVVPAFQSALDAGAKSSHVDVLGDGWTPDQAYVAGGCGYLGSSSVSQTNKSIAGTTDVARFADARNSMYEYRCDGLADGVYTVELGFAEITNTAPNKRIFDVMIEGVEVLPNLDIAREVGTYTALTKTFTVTVTDGVMNIRFIAHTGYNKPIVNSVRVTQRPDLS
ncbi:MAG TPA: S8 family serine peptidase [Micromonosporaceae bacterium]